MHVQRRWDFSAKWRARMKRRIAAFIVLVFATTAGGSAARRAERDPASAVSAAAQTVPVPAGPHRAPYRADHPIAIVGGLLIDATGAAPIHDQTVIVNNGRIVEIGPMERVTIPAGAEVIDATGMTVMPGLIDSNCHIVLSPMYATPDMGMTLDEFKTRWNASWSKAERMAWVYLMQGVTRFRQTPGPANMELAIAKKIERGEIAGAIPILGGSLWMSEVHYQQHLKSYGQTDPAFAEYVRHNFEYNVIKDLKNLDPNGWGQEGPDFNYWKMYLWGEPYDGKNDFSDADLKYIIDRGHQLGKVIDAHCGGGGLPGLRRCLSMGIDTLEHPFSGDYLIPQDIADGFAKQGVIVDTLLTVTTSRNLRAMNPTIFNDVRYIMSLEPPEYQLLLQYRDKLLWNKRHPAEKGMAIYPADSDKRASMTYEQQVKAIDTAKENMRRFIKAGAKFWMGTDTGAFMGWRQENPQATELASMVELGMTPMQAIQSATKNAAEGLKMQKDLGTIEKGKIADIIIVAGNPMVDMYHAMSNVNTVIQNGIRFK
jgi:imidazolonepropionase-like amidohydrolase